MEWLQSHFFEGEYFSRPDWDAIHARVEEDFRSLDQHQLWCDIARSWLEKLQTRLPDRYSIHESENFAFLTLEQEKYVNNLLAYLEKTLRRILRTLPDIASDDGYGKHVVLMFDDIDHYYSYISHFYSDDGEYGLSSGIYLNKGYGHFAFPYTNITDAEPVIVHEMTHALVSHLSIPLWLNEGMAVNVENNFTGYSGLRIDNEMIQAHQGFWGEEEIQEFWNGDSFSRTDEGQRLSYELAQLITNTLAQDYDVFVNFVNKAHFSDGGKQAASEIYEGDLGGLLVNLLGEADWSPKPELWSSES